MKSKNVLWGLVLVIFGVILILDRLNILQVNLLFKGWWTLFIIVPSFIGLFSKDGRLLSFIFFVLGIMLLLNARGILDISKISNLIFPTILVIIGISIIFKNVTNKNEIPEVENKDEYYGTFSHQKIEVDGNFSGCDMNAIFGGVDLDISNANIKNKSVIKVASIFGGCKLIVADNVNIIINRTCIFGSIDDKRKNNKDNKDTIYLDVLCLFGGLDIKNESK